MDQIFSLKDTLKLQKFKIQNLRQQVKDEVGVYCKNIDTFHILLKQHADFLHNNPDYHSTHDPVKCDYFDYYKESNGLYYKRQGTSMYCSKCHLTINIDDKIESVNLTFCDLLKDCSFSEEKEYYNKYKYQLFQSSKV